MLMMSPRRNPARKARPPYAAERPRRVTRSMSRSSDSRGEERKEEGLVEGLKDDQDVKRSSYRTRLVLPEGNVGPVRTRMGGC